MIKLKYYSYIKKEVDIIIREDIKRYLIENNGIISTKEARNLNINTKNLERMEKKGDLKRLAHGLYLYKNFEEDLLYLTQYRSSKAIYSYDTALYLHGLIDKLPEVIIMTIPSGWSTNLLKEKEKYKFFYQKKELWELGQVNLYSPQGNIIKVYDLEKTICDYLVRIEKTKDTKGILLNYCKDKNIDLNKLLHYANIFNVTEKVNEYIKEFENKEL